MIKTITFFLSVIFTINATSAMAQNYYNKTYNFGYYDHPVAIEVDSLENVYICGWFEDENSQNQRGFVMKTDNNGNLVWQIIENEPSKYFSIDLTQTGDIAISGSRNNHCLLRLIDNQTGNEIWSHDEINSDNYWFATVNEILDNSIYNLFVRKTMYGAHKLCYYLFDPDNGNLLKKHVDVNTVYGLTYTSGLMAPDKVWTAGDFDELNGLVRYNNFGSGPYQGTYWTFESLHIAGVQPYSDNMGCTVQYYYSSIDSKYFMQVLTMTLDYLNVYGNSFEIENDTFSVTGATKFNNDKFIITGTAEHDLVLWFIDHDLTEMEEQIIATNKPRAGVDVFALPSMDMVVMGTEEEDNGSDVFLMKLNYDGTVSTEEHPEPSVFTLYPNPGTGTLKIKTALTGNNLRLHLNDVSGREILVQTVYNGKTVNVSGLKAGIYFYRLTAENGTVLKTGKWVKL